MKNYKDNSWNKISSVAVHTCRYDWLTDSFKKEVIVYKSLREACIKTNKTKKVYVSAEFRDDLGLLIPEWMIIQAKESISNYRYYKHHYNKFVFRKGPVENIHKRCWGRHSIRHIKTQQEIRENDFLQYDEDTIEYQIKPRDNRSRRNIPTLWDDTQFARQGNNWKKYRKYQWK